MTNDRLTPIQIEATGTAASVAAGAVGPAPAIIAAGAVVPAIVRAASVADDFESIDTVDAFDPGRFPIVGAFDAAHYPSACTKRYRVAAAHTAAAATAATRYPLLGSRQGRTILLLNDEQNNYDLVDYHCYPNRRTDQQWVLVNKSIVSSTTDINDDMDILPFE
ncbi:unnamed protein product [Rotaria sordida]|uniref:Uncharacterized protein n=1 Tax=Rotaria sordida TaxID=392033 RepID=A0A819LP76_9BILA|nr:unnamed protein product [Rotaria sordida]CAF3970276.1 unnamed protein product [Rotaria sordida]